VACGIAQAWYKPVIPNRTNRKQPFSFNNGGKSATNPSLLAQTMHRTGEPP
jgi:hypothetical protein